MRLLVRVAASVLVTLALLPAAATAQGSVTVVRVRPTAGEGLGKTLTVRLAVVDQFFEPDSQPPVPHLRGRVEADDPATDEFKGTEEADADECGSPLWPKRYRFRGDEIELLGVSREAVTSGSEGARNAIGTLEYLISPAYESGFYDPLSFRGLTWVDFAQRYGLGLLPGPEQLLEGLLTWEMDSLTTVVDVVSSGFDPVNWRPVRELPSSYSWFASDVQTYQGTLDDGTAVTLRFQYAWALPRFAGGRARFAIRNLNSHLPSSYYYDLTVNLNSWLTFREREFAKGTVWGEYQVFDLPPGVLGPGEPLPRIVTADVRVKQWTLRWDFNLFTCDPVLGRIDNLQGVTIDPPGVEGTAEPLQIAGEPRVHYRDASSVTVTWTTTHPSSSRVRVQDYPTGASPRRVERAEFVTEHTLDVTGLDGTAPYTLFVESVSAAGAQVVHRVDRVVARELIDRAPPVISALQEVHTWPYSSAWRWRTDEPARCAVRYRPRQSGEPFSELVNEAFQTVHENLPITGLTPLTGYDLIVRCEDRPGNAAEASEYFETPRQRSGSTVLWGGNVPGSPAPPLNTTISVNDPGEITIEGGVSGAIDPCGVVTCASFSLSVQRLDTGATVLSATASSQSGPVPLGTLKIDPHDVDTIGGLRLIVSGGNVNSVAVVTVRETFLDYRRIADEPSDSPGTATAIPVNADYAAYLWEDANASLTDYSGDADYLQVTLPSPGTATVKVTSPVEFVIAPSTYICEYIRVDVTRADTGALVRGEDVGNCDQTRVTETVATVLVDAADTRTFVIRLAHQYNNSGTPVGSRLAIPATYTVRVEFTPLPLERIADEPNDSPAAPTVIPVNTDYRAYLWEDANASLTDYNGDVDYVQFTVPGPGTAVVKVTSPFPFPASSWSEVMRVATVRTDTGAGVASVDVGANQEGGLTKTLTTLQLGPADWRTYRLSLRHVQLRHDYEFPGGAAFPEPYAVLVEYTPLPLERIADEPNDSPAAPTVIPVNTDYRAYLWEDANASLTDYNGDVDYVQFTVPGPGTAVIKVTSPAPFPVSSWCEVVRVGMSRTDTGAGVASFDAGRCGRGGVTATLATLQLGPTDWRTYRLSVQHVQLRQESVWPGGAAFREPYTVRIDFTPSGGTSPTCAATATPQVGLPPLRVDFSSTVQSADPSTTVRWDFGDGTSSTDRVPTHLYTTPGVYQVAFHAVDSAGTPCSVLLPVNVKEILADAAVSATTGEVPLRIRANAVVQSAVGAPSLYRWDFGDGQSAFGELVEHTYRAAGTFQLQLTVQATTGATAVATTTITVTNSAAFREATGKRFIHPPFSLDVNADGRDETIVTDTAGAIHAYGTNGKDVAGYPIATGARVLAAPLVAAMDGTTAVLVVLTAEPKIRFYGMNGVAATPASVTLPAQPATPLTLADLDGDGLLEAIWADAAGTLHAVNVGGTAAPGFPATLDAAPAGAIAVGELGGDGPHLAFVSADGRLLVLDRRARALGRPVVLGRDAHPLLPPLLSDLDGDGTSEILVASTDGTVHAIDQSFRGLRGFPRRLSAPLSSSPITADLDNDGAREIYALTSDNRLHAWTMTATSVVDVTGFPRVLEATVGQGLRALEVGGDGQGELVFIDDEGTLHVVSATGEARSGYPMALGEAAFLPSFVGTGTGVGYWSVVSTDGYHTARPGAHAVSLVPEGWSRERYDHGGTNAPVPAPADLVASQDPAATSVTVSWKAAHPVMPLDYLVTIVDPVSGTTLDERLVHAGFATFASLSPGSTYDVSVRRLLRAVPRVVGPASGPLRVTVGAPAPPGTPPAPVLTQRGSGRVEVAWTSASPSVRVYYTLGDAAAGPTHAMVATASPVAIDRLVPGETLTVWMTALTGSGTFTESAMSAPAGLSIAALSATPPTDLVADSTGIAGEVLLSWADANTATETYRVHFGRTAGGPYTGSDPAIGDSPLSVRGRAVRLQGLEPGAAYYFVVSAVDGQGGEGSVSDEAMAVPLAESEVVAPILLSALERDQGVELRWQGVSYRNDHRYRVHHGPVEAPASSVVDVGAALTAVIDGVPAGQVRVFQVSAADGRGVESGLSNAITVHRGAPATPAGFVATNAGRGGTVALHWSANTEPDLDGYMLTYGRAGAPSFEVQLPPTAVSRLVTGLEDGRAHEFSLAAFDASGLRGAATSPATATPDASALVIDPFEPDDVPAASRALAVGASEVHTINPVGDEDWFSVAVVSGATYLFTVAAPGDDLSPSLQVWDAEAKTLLRRTHDSSRTGCALGWTADRTGQVLARVRDVEGDAWGQRTGYTFSVQEATGVAGPILFGPIVARELPGADGDGALEPGEPFALDVVLTNGGTLPRTNLLLRVTPRSACVETSSASSMVSGLAGEAVTTRSLAFRVATACPGGTPLRFAIDVEDDLAQRWSLGFEISTSNRPPESNIVSPSENVRVQVGASVSFAGAATDEDSGVGGVRWDFGGVRPDSDSLSPGAVVFAQPGTYPVTFTAFDVWGVPDPSPAQVVVEARSAVPVFTDDPLVARVTPIRAVHVTELRQRIDELRARYGLVAFVWTDASLSPVQTLIRAIHLTELRASLTELYVAAGRPAPTFTPPAVTPGLTAVTAAQIQELRAAVLGIW